MFHMQYDYLAINKVKEHHSIYGHDTIAILWV